MGIAIALAVIVALGLMLALYFYGEKLYAQYPGRGVGRFTSRVVHLTAGIIVGPYFAFFGTAIINGLLQSSGSPILLHPYMMLIIPLVLIVVLGIDYRRHTDWWCRSELLGLCVLIAVLMWVVIPGLWLGFFPEAFNYNYSYNDQYAMAMFGAVFALFCSSVLLMWRAGRLARRYAMLPNSLALGFSTDSIK